MIERTGDVWRAELPKHKTIHFGKSRVLFFNARAQLILRRYLSADPDAPLFAIRRDSLGKAIRAACVKARVPEFTSHWLRHTAVTRIADDMGDEAAQRLAGHAGSAMTEHYARAAEKLARQAAEKLG